jgi:protein O-GlcNAc transferase
MKKYLKLLQQNKYKDIVEMLTTINRNFEESKYYAIALNSLKRFEEAKDELNKIKSYKDYECLVTLGNIYVNEGNSEQAINLYKEANNVKKNNFESKYNLANIYKLQNKVEEAIFLYKESLKENPGNIDAKINLALTYQENNKINEAEEIYKELINKKIYKCYINYGVLLEFDKNYKKALEIYNKALGKTEEDFKIYLNMGNIYMKLGDNQSAENSYRLSRQANVNYYEADINLAVLKYKERKYQEAIKINNNLIIKGIKDKKIYCNLGNIYKEIGDKENSYSSYKRAIEIDPNYCDAICNLGVLYKNYNAYDEAEKCFRYVVKLDPLNSLALGNLGTVLDEKGQLEEAAKCYKRSLDIENKSSILLNYSNLLQKLNYKKESIKLIEEAIINEPSNLEYYSNLIYYSTLDADFNINKKNEILKSYNRLSKRIKYNFSEKIDTKNITLGFVSADFKNHAISNYFLPFLKEIVKLKEYKINLYYNNYYEDRVTNEYKKYCDIWENIKIYDDNTVANLINYQKVDILFDLSSHTSGNRLQVFAMKPSPIQISWLGYPGSTGMEAIDYFISNEYLIPKIEEEYYSEKIMYLKSIAIFDANIDLPIIEDRKNKTYELVFGSFNRINKITNETLAIWVRLLKAIEISSLHIHDVNDDNQKDNFKKYFESNGIDPNRISIFPKMKMYEYLNKHNQIDVCLDTYPYSGSTTTLYSLIMGVPTLSLYGNKLQSRYTYYYHKVLGLENFCDDHLEGLINKAKYVANNKIILLYLRNNLRTVLNASSLIDFSQFYDDFKRNLCNVIDDYNR